MRLDLLHQLLSSISLKFDIPQNWKFHKNRVNSLGQETKISGLEMEANLDIEDKNARIHAPISTKKVSIFNSNIKDSFKDHARSI